MRDVFKAVKALLQSRVLLLKVRFLRFQGRILLPKDEHLRFRQMQLTFELSSSILDQAEALFQNGSSGVLVEKLPSEVKK